MTETLLVLADPVVFDDAARCGAAAGYTVVRADPARCRAGWLRATAVAADGPALQVLAARGLPARDGVLVVAGCDAEPETWRRGLGAGAQGGFVLPEEEADLVAALSAMRRPRRAAAPVLAVAGGHGGAGVSTFAAVLALTASRAGGPVVLLDGDPGGAGLDLLLGAEAAGGLRWHDITGETGSIAGAALSAALPRVSARLSFLTRARDDGSPLSAETVLAVLDAARGEGATVIADVGRAVDPAAGGLLESADLIVVLTRASVPAVAATRKLLARLDDPDRVRLVVRSPAPGGLSERQVAEAVGARLLTGLRSRPGLARACESTGLRSGARTPEVRAARVVLEALGERCGARR